MHPLMLPPEQGRDFTMSIQSPLQHLARWRIPLSLFFCLALALAPSLADARAGSSSSGGGKSSSSSMGSRGTRTYENNNAAPVTRSASEGVQNIVSDVRLLKGDVSEAWEEGDLEYATAFMQWSAIDYVVRLGRSPGQPDYIVSGDPKTPTEAEEVWTFVRRRGGDWLLSAIQQV